MKKKNKIIVFILVFIISFSNIANIQKKETQAFAGVGLLAFKAGVSFTAFAGLYQMMQVNGMHMQISDAITYFTNTFYEKQQDNYVAKEGKVSFLENLAYTTSALISGNDVMDQTELKQAIKEKFDDTLARPINHGITTDLTTIGSKYGISYTHETSNNYSYQFTTTRNTSTSSYMVNDGIRGTIRYFSMGVELFALLPKQQFEFGYSMIKDINDPNKTWIVENMKYVTPNQLSFIVPATYQIDSRTVTDNLLKIRFSMANSNLGTVSIDKEYYPYVSDTIPMVSGQPVFNYQENSYATSPDVPFKIAYPNYYHLLNGQAETIEELQTKLAENELLQQQILEAIQSQTVNTENTIAQPVVDPVTGLITYPDATANPDIPDNPSISVPTGFWQKVMDIPTDIVNGVTGFWEGTINPSWDALKDAVISIPTLITSVWDSTIDVPMESINLNKLNLTGVITKFPFSIPFDYVRVLKSLNRSSIPPDLTIKLNTSYFQINHEIDIQPINKFIVFFRWFVLLTFIYGLMLLTRKVIKW